jgi:hypothetical protein
MPYSHYPHGFVNGVAVRQQVVANMYSGKSNVYWVDSTRGSNGNVGNFNYPFATVDYAVGRCTANNGDIIMVAEGHSETLTSAAAIAIDVAGISIIGLGQGNDRPTFTFTTSTAATVSVTANDVYLHNLRFLCGIASQVIMLDINADRTDVHMCAFGESGESGLTAIDINGGAANACDGVIVDSCEFDCTGANWDRAIELGEVADNVKIINNDIYGDFDDAGIHNVTGKVLTNLFIAQNSVRNLQSGQHAIELVSACTGRLEQNNLYADAYSTTLDPGSLFCNGNLAVNAIDTGGIPIPTQATPDASAQSFTGIGTEFWVKKTVTSSTITTASAVDITGVSSGGELAILNIVCKTDSTGLAGGTNFQVKSNNTKGLANILAEAVANLGANKTVDLSSASVTKQPTVLESGAKLQVQNTVGDGTGAGTIDIYIHFQRLTAGATISAA